MKIRTDFVTNSSSSSFIIARNKEFSKQEEEIMLKHVQSLLGKLVLSPESTEEDIENFFNRVYCDEKEKQKIIEELKKGNSIFAGSIDFECSEYVIKEIYQELWSALQKENKNMIMITDDMIY